MGRVRLHRRVRNAGRCAAGDRPLAGPMKEYRERAVTFGPRGSIVGVVTTPPCSADPDLPTIVILNAGVIHRIGPNRLHVRMARDFAQSGYSVLRFDLSGVGDSESRRDEVDLERAVQRDIENALDFLVEEYGADSFVIAGLCSGAHNGFRFATQDQRVVGAIL